MTDWDHELPDFLRFNKYGGVLSKDDREEVARSKGVCPTCGRVTHKITHFRSIPLDNENVSRGICLHCRPDHKKVTFSEPPPVLAGGKAAKLLGVNRTTSDVSAGIRSKKTVKQIRDRAKNETTSDVDANGTSKKAPKKFRHKAKRVIDRQNSDSNNNSHRTEEHEYTDESTDPDRQAYVDPSSMALSREIARVPGMAETTDDAGMAVRSKTMTEKIAKTHSPHGRYFGRTTDHDLHTLIAQSINQTKMSHRPGDPSKKGYYLNPPSSGEGQARMTDQNVLKRASLVDMKRKYHSTPDSIPKTSLLRGLSDDVWDLVKEMRSHPDDVQLLTSKCEKLRNLAMNQAGSSYEILEVMRRFPNEKSLLIASIGALWSIGCDGGDDGKTEILDAGGAGLIMECLRKFPDDFAMSSWGFGTLSNLGGGIGGRAYLEEAGVVQCIENKLKMFYFARDGIEVFYWVLRCLATLIYYSDSDGSAIDVADLEEDFDVSERSRATIVADTEIIHLALLAVNSAPIDGITLELAFKLLSHFDTEIYVGDNHVLLMKACEKAIQTTPCSSFPTLHHLACAVLCRTIKMDSSSDHEEFISPIIFASVAMDALTSHMHQRRSSISSGSSSLTSTVFAPPHSLEVMVVTLSHLLCFSGTTLGFAESKNALKICCCILENDESSVFLQNSCCWIIWSIFCYETFLIEDTNLASETTAAIQVALTNIENSPTQLTVGFAALSEVVVFTSAEANPLVEMTVRLAKKYSNVEMLHKEACQLLFNLCKTEELAAHIVSTGGIDVVKKSIEDPRRQIQSAVHLMIKLSVLADDELTIEDFEIMINACVQLKKDSTLAAKSWLGFLTGSITPARDDFAQQSPMAINSINEIMEAYPKDENMQRYTCMALRNMAASVQRAKLPLDISACVPLVLAAQKEHGDSILKDCGNALWALMGLQCQLESTLMKEVAHFVIEVLVNPNFSFGHASSESTTLAGMAIFADMFSDPISATQQLGEKILHSIVDVVNKTIYLLLDSLENCPSIFEFAFCTLHHLCGHDLCRGIIASHGGVVAVIDGMSENLENASIQENGCNILRYLAGIDLRMKLTIVESDAVPVIMDVIIFHGSNESVLSEAFQALSCLSVDKSSRNFIAQQGGIMLMANSMSALTDNVAVQEAGLSALCSLASDVEEGILQTSNIFSVVNDSLDRHAVDASIQRKGLALFYNLSMRGEGIKNRLLSSGCLESITKAVEVHTACSVVVSSALRMLVNLSGTDQGMHFLFEEKVLDLIIHTVMLNVNDLKVAIVGCKILNIIYDKSNGISIGVYGVEAILYVMMFHHRSEYVQSIGCHILACSSSQSFLSNEFFGADSFDLKRKIMDVTLSAMSCFPKCVCVQSEATTVLMNMAKLEENIEVLSAEQVRIEDALNWAMANFPKYEPRCRKVLETLANY